MSNVNEEKSIYTVYVHKLSKEISGYEFDKYYVGLTRNSVEKRWGHGKNYRYGNFKQDIEKYGWNSFEHIIIANNQTPNQAALLEKVLIRVLHSVDPDYGYNRTRGGEMTSEETGEKMKSLIAERQRYFNSLPYEDQQMILQSRYTRGDDNPMSKRVHQFTLEGEYIRSYESVVSAAKALNISRSTVYSVAQHHAKSTKGFILAYDDNILELDSKITLKRNYYTEDSRNKPIMVYDRDKNFVTELSGGPAAARFFNIHPDGVSGLIHKRTRKNNKILVKDNYYLFLKEDSEGIDNFLNNNR